MAQRKPPPPQLPPRANVSPVSHLLYYHPHLRDLSDVREVMLPYVMQDGSFLLRNSSKRKDTYTVSVMHDKSIKHFYIFRRDNCFYLQDKYFGSIDKLIAHYKHEDVPNMEAIKHIRLLHPIKNPHQMTSPSAEPTDYEAYSFSEPKSAKKSKKSSRFFFSLPRKKDSSSYANFNGDPMPNGVAERSSESPSEPPAERPIPTPRARKSSERAAMPLPKGTGHHRNANPTEGKYYSAVDNLEVSRIPALLSMLQVDERAKCDCGLYFDEATLPRDWTMHISHEPNSEGRVFFMGPDQQTAWNLPLEVACELSQDQQERIRSLLDRYHHDRLKPAPSEHRLRSISDDGEEKKLNEASGGYSASVPTNYESPEYLTGGDFRDQGEFSQYPR
ncbi:hypothetical protein CAPTEDRAFT_187428 [Capitella teleta]|uniref:SH2 domain-containing protein n=1 Tax=Capitella teleta TaxID=283909 RepID=R7TI27_CAPTE|nr:hypothetical protein CAPTEDRAFT_187428 [Capitella teleta]|eukprot:ELT90740.1 hypothetical protein CAPTEDRAFT_187428 [Capitella teleta]